MSQRSKISLDTGRLRHNAVAAFPQVSVGQTRV